MATLASYIGDAAAIREELRILCGYPGDLVMLPDASCNAYLRMALSRINTMDPVIGIGSFPTVAGTQVYAPLPANAQSVRQAWWPGCNPAWLAELDARFGQPIDEIGTRTALDPATVALVLRNVDTIQRWIGTGFAVVNRGAEIYMGPVPASVQTVYFSFLADRFATSGDVTTEYFEAFWAAAGAAALAGVAVGAGAITQVQDTQEGTSVTLSSGSAAKTRAAELDMRFLRIMAVPPAPGWLFG